MLKIISILKKIELKEGGAGGSLHRFACFPTVCVGFPQSPPTVQKRAH